MTHCTICAAPCPGDDDDDEACCDGCHAANFAGAELRPLAWVWRERRLPGYMRTLPTPAERDLGGAGALVRAV